MPILLRSVFYTSLNFFSTGSASISDFAINAPVIIITAGSTGEHCASISIFEDTLFEQDETFILTLTVTNNSSGVTLDNNMVVVTIVDNDGKGIVSCLKVTFIDG